MTEFLRSYVRKIQREGRRRVDGFGGKGGVEGGRMSDILQLDAFPSPAREFQFFSLSRIISLPRPLSLYSFVSKTLRIYIVVIAFFAASSCPILFLLPLSLSRPFSILRISLSRRLLAPYARFSMHVSKQPRSES